LTDTHPEMVRIMSIRATPKATVKNKIFEGRKKGKELNPKKINFEKFPEKKKTRNLIINNIWILSIIL